MISYNWDNFQVFGTIFYFFNCILTLKRAIYSSVTLFLAAVLAQVQIRACLIFYNPTSRLFLIDVASYNTRVCYNAKKNTRNVRFRVLSV